jgi:hypothetical protein
MIHLRNCDADLGTTRLGAQGAEFRVDQETGSEESPPDRKNPHRLPAARPIPVRTAIWFRTGAIAAGSPPRRGALICQALPERRKSCRRTRARRTAKENGFVT